MMKQLIQNFKTGELYVDEVPFPSLEEGYVLVANRFSLISAGTEKTTVSTGKASLIGKAKKRPDLVKQVIANYKKEGFKATLEKIKTKLDSLKALGYSTSGVVMASMDTNNFFKPGDRVACAGLDYATHSEVVCVPQNLVVKIPDGVDFDEACFSTLGSIALQGIRQANPTLGENVCVIGLGLLGQITCQLLKANGCRVFGIDVSSAMVDLAVKTNAAVAMVRNDDSLYTATENFTRGYGFDKVIITAGAASNDPVELAGQLSRKKGTVVVVGAVKMDIPRDPDYYRKELEVKMSCSYGPGRYDPSYEEDGIDYPYGYVRWTEQRNMQAFLDQASSGAINLKPLITHVFDIENAVEAYDIILGKKKEMFVGILLKYSEDTVLQQKKIFPVNGSSVNRPVIGFIGAGSFAQSYLIPNVISFGEASTVVTRTGINAKNVAGKFKFKKFSTDPADILHDSGINTVFIATQHDTHAEYVLKAIENNKNIFVEKPLAVNDEELDAIISAYNNFKGLLLVGFNRRFSDIAITAKNEFTTIGEPLLMNFRVNGGFIPKDHWIQGKAGAGRIIGEVCHFIDFMQFFAGADPVKVFAESVSSQNSKITDADNIAITVKFNNGTVGNLLYSANGDKGLPKERFEIFGGNKVFIIDDFRNGTLYKNNKVKTFKNTGKGHKQEIESFFSSLNNGTALPVTFESMCYTTRTTFRILDSIVTGLPQEIVL
jgi:predicted dehydrogenase/threonine dehydrogenase-like Zn-dependent dehydrogenase